MRAITGGEVFLAVDGFGSTEISLGGAAPRESVSLFQISARLASAGTTTAAAAAAAAVAPAIATSKDIGKSTVRNPAFDETEA